MRECMTGFDCVERRAQVGEKVVAVEGPDYLRGQQFEVGDILKITDQRGCLDVGEFGQLIDQTEYLVLVPKMSDMGWLEERMESLESEVEGLRSQFTYYVEKEAKV
ncbi:hypothetical protein [Mechercharimyces sp. CAU 1602]|uniref:hypothetical protein n=1 Tax=Mechercharimyces sp. CAU 1602 TaxID=2973933 RepID=UPI0021623448|nr:hypothetical protein [Mechercharimyces sp. CAU 1602]MCS1350368.1 hypothetical protein [Mechercharimyces sp. CAU 1602]